VILDGGITSFSGNEGHVGGLITQWIEGTFLPGKEVQEKDLGVGVGNQIHQRQSKNAKEPLPGTTKIRSLFSSSYRGKENFEELRTVVI